MLKIKIESHDYHTYYKAIEEEEPTIRCLLWLQFESFKKVFAGISKKAFGDVPASWLNRRLGLHGN